MVPWRYKGVFVASHPYYIFFLQGSPTILPLPVKQHSKFHFDLEIVDNKSHHVDCPLLNSHCYYHEYIIIIITIIIII